MSVPAACHDTALSAFAQLAVLRLGARRAFITILSTSTEYVMVEAPVRLCGESQRCELDRHQQLCASRRLGRPFG
jgi:hypothetical protein